MNVAKIEYVDTKYLLLEVHYAKRMPSISWAYGLFNGDRMMGCITYGKPASPWLCMGVTGKENRKNVYELNRLVLVENKKNQASYLIASSLKLLPPGLTIVSYADTKQDHIGYIYQATNWLYTGQTKPRTDMLSDSGHSRHNLGNKAKRQDRSSKHRYINFTGTKRDKRLSKEKLRYKVYDKYPKNDTLPVYVKTLS